MKTDYIEFKKKRELSDILSDSFAFFKSQFKPLLTTFFKIIGPYLLVMLISLGLYIYALSSIFNLSIESLSGFDFEPLSEFYPLVLTVAFVFVLFVLGITASVMSQSSILYFIESYIDTNGTTNFLEIKKKVYQNFWSFFGLGILVGLSIAFGLLFCFIPGIYLYAPLSLTFAIYVFSKKDVITSYNYSFTLVKNEWWVTFATLLVMGMIIGIAGAAFSMPATIYSWIKMGVSASEYNAESSSLGIFADPIYIVLYVVAMIFKFALNIITIVSSVLIYFNLNEKKNFTGTYERIQNLGQTPEN